MTRLTDRYRIFGSPFSSVFHQHLTYLHLKRLPVKAYCSTFATTKLYSLYHRSKHSFCAQTPSGKDHCLLLWQLIDKVERQEVEAAAVKHDTHRPARKMMLDRRTHPNLHMVSWAIMLYGSWWLPLTGSMYRWVQGDASSIVRGYMNYFLLMSGGGMMGPFAEQFRKMMCHLLSVHGVAEESRPYFTETFERMCQALEAHFREHDPAFKGMKGDPSDLKTSRARRGRSSAHRLEIRSDGDHRTGRRIASLFGLHGAAPEVDLSKRTKEQDLLAQSFESDDADADQGNNPTTALPYYILGTPHPTIADVAFGSVFGAYFLLDDPPASTLSTKYPALSKYIRCVSGFPNLVEGESFPAPLSDLEESLDDSPFPDTVPESLASFLCLVEEILPFMAEQCDALQRYMSTEGILQLKQVTLSGKGAEGYEGLRAYLLPQRTEISSVMVIDRNILTVLSRAQDLEVALLAAREVMDKELGPFNSLLSNVAGGEGGEDATAGAAAMTSSPAANAMEDIPHPQEAGNGSLKQPSSLTDASPTGDLLTATAQASSSSDVTTASDDEPPPHITSDPLFHHVFTSQGRKNFNRFAVDFVPTKSIPQLLLSLQRLFASMHMPQFSLVSVTLNKRVYTAAIPEHEYAKKRSEVQARAQSSKSES